MYKRPSDFMRDGLSEIVLFSIIFRSTRSAISIKKEIYIGEGERERERGQVFQYYHIILHIL